MKQKKKLNILFSTTRQWNPGDEFILMGCIHLLTEIADINPIIYNKNPQIRYLVGWKRKWINNIFKFIFRIPLFSQFVDNSIKPSSSGDWIDLVVFAGSPSWYGEPSRDLYKLILKYQTPVIYLGIGLGENIEFKHLRDDEIKVLKRALMITVRDQRTARLLRSIATQKPCPALFSSREQRIIKKVDKVGLIFASHHGPKDNRVSDHISKRLEAFYKALIPHYPDMQFEIICHYIDEVEVAFRNFNDMEIHYSYDSKDYLEIYRRFDLVIGSRVHGIGIAASMGIPGVMISHDVRSDTVKGFLARIINIDDDVDMNLEIINQEINQVNGRSKALLGHKKAHFDYYTDSLSKVIHGF